MQRDAVPSCGRGATAGAIHRAGGCFTAVRTCAKLSAASLRRRGLAAPPPRHSSAHDILNTTHHSLHHGPRQHDPRPRHARHALLVWRDSRRYPRPRRIGALSRRRCRATPCLGIRGRRSPSRPHGRPHRLRRGRRRVRAASHGLTLRQPARRRLARRRARRRVCARGVARAPRSLRAGRVGRHQLRRRGGPVVDAHGLALLRRPRRSAALKSQACRRPRRRRRRRRGAPLPRRRTRRPVGSASSRRTSSRARASSAPTHRSASSRS